MSDLRSARNITRRDFTTSATAGVLGALATSSVVTASKTNSGDTIVGTGAHQYEVDHDWAELPDRFTWQTSHNVAVGSEGLIYVIHEGHLDKPDHPAIFVFDEQGRFVRAFGEQFQGGGHGIEVRNEGGDDFLYVCAYHQQRSFAKLDSRGEIVWRQGAPMQSGRYPEGEDLFPRKDNPWGRDRFLPTNIAFHPKEGFFVADGYGAWCIHYYDAEGEWVRTFGGPADSGSPDGTFNLPHGIWIDDRGNVPKIVIADRANARLQWFDLEGNHLQTLDGFHLPANIDIRGELMLVPDLYARVTLLDKINAVVAQLGDDIARVKADEKFSIRGDESKWLAGKFVHPHDACFDAEGNIYVAEWVKRGRVTRLRKLS